MWIVFDHESSSQKDLPKIKLYGCSFHNMWEIQFKLYGVMSLIGCEFNSDFEDTFLALWLLESQFEPEVEGLEDLVGIEINQTIIEVPFLGMQIDNVKRRLQMENVDLNVSKFYIDIGIKNHNDCTQSGIFELEVINCKIKASFVICVKSSNWPSIMFWFKNTVFEEVLFESPQCEGFTGFTFHKCNFNKALHVEIQNFIIFNMFHTSVNLPYDCEGQDCVINLIGVYKTKVIGVESNILIMNTTFKGGYGPFFSINVAHMVFLEVVFNIEVYVPHSANLIDFQTRYPQLIYLEGVLINITSIEREVQQTNIMSIWPSWIIFLNTQILCPFRMNAVEKLPLKSFDLRAYHCQTACISNMYIFQSGNMTLRGDTNDGINIYDHFENNKSLVTNLMNPHCNQCPVGGKCSGNIKALPNYWGYINEDDVVMIRCPSGYCCQDNETCQNFDSCNSNRKGALCGVCEKNLVESLFNTTCISQEKCYTWLIGLLYISSAIGYGLGLMVIDPIKEIVLYLLKKIFICIKRTLLKKAKRTQDMGKSTISKKETREGSFKYLQILFYYVQDATLFRIDLPGQNLEQTSTVVKILQFTPEIITSIYSTVTRACFSLATTAISKILFKSIFGPSVMLFLFILYLCQSCFFSVTKRKSKFHYLIKYKLVQSFVMVILLSYQQIVTGAFTLVKCINIGNENVLYAQANIQCFTLWQMAIEILIWVSIFPAFIVFSHIPYYVEIKQMSVQMFILVCLLPVPGLIIFHLTRAWKKFKKKSDVQNHSDIELNIVADGGKDYDLREIQVSQEEMSSLVAGMGFEISLNIGVSTDRFGLTDITSDSDTDIGSEYSRDLLPQFKTHSKQGTLTDTDHSKKIDFSGTISKVDDEIINESSRSFIEHDFEENGKTSDTNKCSKNFTQLDLRDEDFVDSKEAITETLLKNYKTMTLFRVSFNWLAIHKIYRLILVACNTYISHSVIKLSAMTSCLLGIMLLHSLLKPYKQLPANIAAAFSYLANCGIAIINLIKAGLSEYDCKINCSDKTEFLWYLDIAEKILFVYVPVVSVCIWLLSEGLQKCIKKPKKE